MCSIQSIETPLAELRWKIVAFTRSDMDAELNVTINSNRIPFVPLPHLLDLLLGDDGAAVAHPDAALEVVEVLPVALEELDEEDAQVGVGLRGVDARVQLQEAHQQQDQRVRRQTAREDLRGVMV